MGVRSLYLHGFTDPHIFEYDSLTDTARWNEYADVILANPPFMSPKGGIRPHNRFSIQAKRSEVLFVDYIAEHLTPNGRAGIIVPEGIIFQSQNAYKDLRKKLVENSLVAVISLPAGCFNPYSGVKTSILLLDKSLARKTQTIAFFKVENDGYDLGAQRRPIQKNDLPKVREELESYLATLRERKDPSELTLTTALIVPKEKIAANGDYKLTGDQYREGAIHAGLEWPLVPIGDLCVVERGASPRPINDFITDAPDGVNWIKIGDAELGAKYITSTKERVTPAGAAKSRRVKPGDFILSNSMSFGRPYIMATDGCIHDGWLLLRDHSEKLDQDFLYNILGSLQVFAQFEQAATGGVVNNLNSELVRRVKIPLPPLEIQKEIVAEIEDYQKVINGARAILDNYRPHIPINPDWPMVELGVICDLYQPKTITQQDLLEDGAYLVFGANGVIGRFDQYNHEEDEVLITCRGATCGTVNRSEPKSWITGNAMVAHPKDDRISKDFLFSLLKGSDLGPTISGSAQPQITRQGLAPFSIPLPPLAEQQAIVAEIEAEQALVNANRELITRFETKIQTTLSRIWGDESSVS